MSEQLARDPRRCSSTSSQPRPRGGYILYAPLDVDGGDAAPRARTLAARDARHPGRCRPWWCQRHAWRLSASSATTPNSANAPCRRGSARARPRLGSGSAQADEGPATAAQQAAPQERRAGCGTKHMCACLCPQAPCSSSAQPGSEHINCWPRRRQLRCSPERTKACATETSAHGRGPAAPAAASAWQLSAPRTTAWAPQACASYGAAGWSGAAAAATAAAAAARPRGAPYAAASRRA